jgi:hypothetical protein
LKSKIIRKELTAFNNEQHKPVGLLSSSNWVDLWVWCFSTIFKWSRFFSSGRSFIHFQNHTLKPLLIHAVVCIWTSLLYTKFIRCKFNVLKLKNELSIVVEYDSDVSRIYKMFGLIIAQSQPRMICFTSMIELMWNHTIWFWCINPNYNNIRPHLLYLLDYRFITILVGQRRK